MFYYKLWKQYAPPSFFDIFCVWYQFRGLLGVDVHDSNRSFHGLSTGKLLPVFLKKNAHGSNLFSSSVQARSKGRVNYYGKALCSKTIVDKNDKMH